MLDLSSPKQVSDLLRENGLRAQKRLGQNFLCDRNILNRIAGTANLTPADSVVEIGGGLGALTLTLASFCKSVTCIEIDHGIEPLLRQHIAESPNVNLILADFLRMDHEELFSEAFSGGTGYIVANIPYYISSPILEILLKHKRHLRKIVMLVQQEFANRLVAAPGSDDCGSLSLFAQYHASIEIAFSVPRTVFLPPPDVGSAVIMIEPKIPGTVPVKNEERMLALIRAGFGQRRKTIVNALMRSPASYGLNFGMEDRPLIEGLLREAGIDPQRRGETLSLPEYARLADAAVPD